jgi:hypothetical protein
VALTRRDERIERHEAAASGEEVFVCTIADFASILGLVLTTARDRDDLSHKRGFPAGPA